MYSKILLANLGILFTYMVGLTLIFGGGVLFASILFIGLHFFINILMFIVYYREKKPKANASLLSALLILLIGYPSCVGLASI